MSVSRIMFSQDPSGSDMFVCPLDVSAGRTQLRLITQYQGTKEQYWLYFNPNYRVDSQQIGRMVTQVMPSYPDAPLDQIARVHSASLELLRAQSSPEKERNRASLFLLANRIVRAYNEDVTKDLGISLEKMVREYAFFSKIFEELPQEFSPLGIVKK